MINREIDRAPLRPGPERVLPGLASSLHPHFEQDGGIRPVHCVRDTWGAERHPELKVAGDVVRRPSISSRGTPSVPWRR